MLGRLLAGRRPQDLAGFQPAVGTRLGITSNNGVKLKYLKVPSLDFTYLNCTQNKKQAVVDKTAAFFV
ncbi:hypothetical protein B8W93_09810 [Lentilactobacillus kefiri]|uniref:Uncharacterized protein n=1 Tax=Lentilactobacillus kefiri TaxID=33962 RepID=A0A511DVS9_LENKE|nr:hypothetical protein [Lentilactobacillus kefiri]PAK58879.1 hypothetical protein B9K02_09160 [Lentilactobacillus kefiri]PAK81440.1 hypothetical protein B8W85_09950 [Lentilactobacillus kefiri]PAL05503.1 hypothetical protein B8W93_09810 [Lentilactobacillus kefiri]QGV24227.1 hypothetical protein DNL43_02605 [Lentilactobacillus kefiri]GEL28950.1 hypothetical protein LKE01_17700 [Lentilactobacillus kefiri]